MLAKKATKKIAAKNADQYMLRFPEGMRDQLAALAEANGRSMNTEVIAALERHLQRGSDIEQLEAKLDRLWAFVREIDRRGGIPGLPAFPKWDEV